MLDTIYMYRAFCAARSTEYVYSTMLYSHAELAIYSRLVTVQNTPSPCLSDTTSQVEPVSPLDGGFMRRSLPYAAGESTGEGANNNQNYLGHFGFVAGNPCSGPFLYMAIII